MSNKLDITLQVNGEAQTLRVPPSRTLLDALRGELALAGTKNEGLLHDGQLAAFVDAGAIQCGYCMSGMIVTATALLADNPAPTREEIRAALSGNLCRCSGYVRVVDAVQLAAERLGQ